MPPFVDDGAINSTLLATHGIDADALGKTIFDGLEENLPPSCATSLDTQHRMAPQIGKLVSDCFYAGALKSAPQDWVDSFAPQLPRPVTCFTTSHIPNRFEARIGTSYSNAAEARVIFDLLTRLDFLAAQKQVNGWDVSWGEMH